MKVTFIYTDISSGNNQKFNMGIAQLSSCLKQAGHQTSLIHIFEEINERSFINLVKSHSPDILAFSSISNLFPHIKEFAKLIKNNFDLPVIYGGPHPTIASQECIDTGLFDIICRGEGERAIVELCDKLVRKENITGIQNLWIKKDDHVYKNPLRPLIEDLDSLPSLDYGIFNYETLVDATYFKRLVIMAHRGCPYNCTYCCNHAFKELYPNQNRYVRFRSVDKVIKQIEQGLNQYPFLEEVRFFDDNLTLNKSWFRDFAREYKKRIGLPYSTNDRVNHMDKEAVYLLKSSGCYFVELGIESGNEQIRQRTMNRGTSEEQIINAFYLCRKYGIKTSAFNIIGVPGETLSSALDTIKLNARAKPDWSYIFYFHPYVGTKLYQLAKDRRLLSHKTFKSIFEGPTLILNTISESQISFAYVYFRGLIKLYRFYFSLPDCLRVLLLWATDNLLNNKYFPNSLLVKIYQPLYKFYNSFSAVYKWLSFHCFGYQKTAESDKDNKKTLTQFKKIFFIIGYIFPPKAYGGGNLIHRKLYEYLKSQGIDVIPISMGDILVLLGKGWKKEIYSIPVLGNLFVNLWLCWRLRACKGIIFTDHYYCRYLILYKFLQRFFFGSKIIISFFHSDYYNSDAPVSLKKLLIKLREYIGFKFGHSIITISQHAKNEIISVGTSPTKINVITPGIDTSEFIHFLKEKSDKINLLFVGHLRSRKGLDYLIHACSQLRNQNYVMNIVARKENLLYFEKLQNLVKKYKLDGRILFQGELLQDTEGRKKLSYLYSQADIFVFPSLWEGLGIVLLEAMYYKLPIITSRVSAMPELVTDGENGLLVPPADPEALAEAISRLIDNPSLRKDLGERGYQRVTNSYSWESAGERFYQIVKELSK